MKNVVASANKSGEPPAISHLYLLGRMRATGPDGSDILPKPLKTRALLGYLCLSRGETLLRTRLAGLIWDRSGEEQARDSLRHALRELDQAGGSWRLERKRQTVRLDASGCWVDAFEAPNRSDLLLDDLYGVSSAFDQWLVSERVRFEIGWQTALEKQLADLTERIAAPALRARVAQQLLNIIPTHEGALRALMTAFVDMDERAEAIRECERFRILAKANGMPVSERTLALYEAVRAAAPPPVMPLRGRTQPVATPAFAPPEQTAAAAIATASAPNEMTGAAPTIAVLPFRNLSDEQSRDRVVEGLVEDLIETLSRVPSLSVASRLAAAGLREQDRSPQEIGAALGVRYLVSGSLRLTGDRSRLIVELTEADAGKVLCIAKFEEETDDLLVMQNRLAATIVRLVAPHVRYAELQRIRIKRPENLDACDLLLCGQESMNSSERALFEAAGPLFASAIERQPRYSAAFAWKAYWHVMRVGQGWSFDPAADTVAADNCAATAVECDAAEPMALAVQGYVAACLHRDFDLALARFEAALQINPNSARAWLWDAYAHAWMGDGAHAVEKVTRAMVLSPFDPLTWAYSGGASIAYLADGQYERAIEFALRCVRANRSYTAAYKKLIIALALAGREAEARSPLDRLLLLEPDFTVQEFRRQFPGSGRPLGELCCVALAKAGVPLSA